MNRRGFLKRAAASSFGAAGTILIPNSVAAELLNSGGAEIKSEDIVDEKRIITREDIVDEKRIITREDLVEEVVDMSQFGDNLVDLLLNADGPLTFRRKDVDGMDLFRVWGITHQGAKFKQHGKYKIAHAGNRNTIGWRSRELKYNEEDR